jgi:hypothetical protein
MLTYAGLALAILKFVNGLMNFIDREQARQSGIDSEIAKQTLAIANKTAAGKAIMEKVNAMSDADVDAGLAGLEPK